MVPNEVQVTMEHFIHVKLLNHFNSKLLMLFVPTKVLIPVVRVLFRLKTNSSGAY